MTKHTPTPEERADLAERIRRQNEKKLQEKLDRDEKRKQDSATRVALLAAKAKREADLLEQAFALADRNEPLTPEMCIDLLKPVYKVALTNQDAKAAGQAVRLMAEVSGFMIQRTELGRAGDFDAALAHAKSREEIHALIERDMGQIGVEAVQLAIAHMNGEVIEGEIVEDDKHTDDA
jgi:hypothetical protein